MTNEKHKKEQENRVEFLARTYNVFEMEELDDIRNVENYENFNIEIMDFDNKNVLAIISSVITKKSEYEGEIVLRIKKSVRFSEIAFIDIISADPTPKKFYSQWMLKTVERQLKDNDFDGARRFMCEDLHQANEFLGLFDEMKKKKTFKENAITYANILKIKDPCDINQYRALSQVYDVVDPFIVRDVSALEKTLKHFVSIKQAEIVFRDRICTLYIPYTRAASEVFGQHTSWCTASKGNSMFDSYTKRLTPLGTNSKLYVIIPNTYFTGETDDLFQMHVESSQFMDRKDKSVNFDLFRNKFLNNSEMLSTYLYDTFLPMARLLKKVNNYGIKSQQNRYGSSENSYYNMLKKLGYGNLTLDLIKDDDVAITINNEILIKPDFTRFKYLKMLVLIKNGLKEFPNLSKCKSLEVLTIREGKFTIIPDNIGELTSLKFLNIFNNNIESFPDSIKYLDPINGGSLKRMCVREEEIGPENCNRLRKLLPSVDLFTDK